MKLRYYMRGVGTGIVITALILLVSKQPKEMTDAEIKIRAAALGMVDESIFLEEGDLQQDIEEKEYQSKKEDTDVINTTTEEITDLELKEEETEEVSDEVSENVTEIVKNPEDPELIQKDNFAQENEEGKERQYVSITVESGDVARIVSRKLYEAGLIESEEEYNNFLSGNNYSYRLRAGNYEIPIGADHKEIAEILCKITEE